MSLTEDGSAKAADTSTYRQPPRARCRLPATPKSTGHSLSCHYAVCMSRLRIRLVWFPDDSELPLTRCLQRVTKNGTLGRKNAPLGSKRLPHDAAQAAHQLRNQTRVNRTLPSEGSHAVCSNSRRTCTRVLFGRLRELSRTSDEISPRPRACGTPFRVATANASAPPSGHAASGAALAKMHASCSSPQLTC